ncbi:hypothetical protein BG006_011373 [Podila minutissima]|uniref:SCP domain-containing protein n=1 Tax=Podila minutissima TaxID=64525 RepID=A0A9P5SC28_9FUNG|nr:hypothetical protein BG006_011373 [Podila minutissima]
MVKLTTLLMATVAIVAVSAQGISQEPVSVAISDLENFHISDDLENAGLVEAEAQEVDDIEEPIDIRPFGAHVSLAKRAPAPPKKTATLTKEQKQILDTHNKFRAAHGAAPLTWNSKAATFGNNWIQACQFKHSGGPFGENLAAGYKDYKSAITAWYDEEKQYNYNNPGFSGATGHFTQVVWKGTKSVGCAKKFCPGSNWTIYICNYKSGGNIVGDNGAYFRKNVLPKRK